MIQIDTNFDTNIEIEEERKKKEENIPTPQKPLYINIPEGLRKKEKV